MTSSASLCLAYFISPHGYGHAARAAAVMEAIHQRRPDTRFEVFTLVPAWFLADSLTAPFSYHPLLTDIGLVQKNSLIEDLPQTLRRLDDFLPFAPEQIDSLAQQVKQLHCNLIICDIAPLGLAVAQSAHLPSLLIENFTWDWIYEGYPSLERQLNKHIVYLQTLFRAADFHLQTEPVCQPNPGADLTTTPISRSLRTTASAMREQLGLPAQARVVLLTMGGTPWDYTFLAQLESYDGVYFVIPGGADCSFEAKREQGHCAVRGPGVE